MIDCYRKNTAGLPKVDRNYRTAESTATSPIYRANCGCGNGVAVEWVVFP